MLVERWREIRSLAAYSCESIYCLVLYPNEAFIVGRTPNYVDDVICSLKCILFYTSLSSELV